MNSPVGGDRPHLPGRVPRLKRSRSNGGNAVLEAGTLTPLSDKVAPPHLDQAREPCRHCRCSRDRQPCLNPSLRKLESGNERFSGAERSHPLWRWQNRRPISHYSNLATANQPGSFQRNLGAAVFQLLFESSPLLSFRDVLLDRLGVRPSTRSLASLRPRPVISRTTLMTLIFLAASKPSSWTVNSVGSAGFSATAGPPRRGAAMTTPPPAGSILYFSLR